MITTAPLHFQVRYSKHFGTEENLNSGKIYIDYPSSRTSDSQYIDGKIELTPNIEIESDVTIRIEDNGGFSISPCIVETKQGVISKDIKIHKEKDINQLDIDVIVEKANSQYSEKFEVSFDDLELLSIGDELFQEATFDPVSFRTRVNNHAEDDGPIWPLINFASDLSEYTEFQKFLNIIEIYIDNYAKINLKKESILDTILKRTLLGKIGNGRHHMHRLSQFESVINEMVVKFGSESVDPSKSLRYALEELDNNEELGGLIQLSRELQIVDLYPEAIIEKTFAILLAEEIKRQSEEGARNLVDQYFEDNENQFDKQQYQERLDEAKNLDSHPEAQKEWFDLLSYAQTSLKSEEFKFLIASYLYWTADKHSGNKSYYYVTPYIYEAAADWFKILEIDGFTQNGYFESEYRRGLYYYHNEQYQEASSVFQLAISICTNESEKYKKPRTNLLNYPIIYKTLSDSKNLVIQEKPEEAAELLEDREKIIKNLNILSENQEEKILSSIRGERFRIMAKLMLSRGNYERSKELLEKSIGLFKRSNFNTSFEITLLLKLEVEVIIQEVNGEFEDAAQKHQELSNDDRYSTSKQFLHAIRSDICHIKSKTRDKKYDEALDILKKVNRTTDDLHDEPRQLGILLRVLSNYEDDKLSDVQRAIEKISTNIRSSSDHPLDVEYDYTEPLVVVLAMERLNQTVLPENLLNSILELSVERALTPKHNTGVVKESYIGDISIDRLWRERLPSIVLNRVEKIQIDSVSVPGGFKGVTLLLAELVEFYMALLIEYHAKSYWGSSWRAEITREDQDEDNLSIGTLAQVFNSDAAQNIDNGDVLEDIYYKSCMDFDNLTQMRNRYDHAYKGSVSKKQFESLKEWVFKFLKESVQDSPIIISVDGGNDFDLYQVNAHWWRGQRKIGIETKADLDRGSFYYIPAHYILGSKEQVTYTVDESDIFEVDDNRVKDQIRELPKFDEGSEGESDL